MEENIIKYGSLCCILRSIGVAYKLLTTTGLGVSMKVTRSQGAILKMVSHSRDKAILRHITPALYKGLD